METQTYKIDGIDYVTDQHPYIAGTGDETYYTVTVESASGDIKTLRWEVLDGWTQDRDESESCDWDVFTVTL